MTSARVPAPVTTNRHNPTLESHRPHRSAAPPARPSAAPELPNRFLVTTPDTGRRRRSFSPLPGPGSAGSLLWMCEIMSRIQGSVQLSITTRSYAGGMVAIVTRAVTPCHVSRSRHVITPGANEVRSRGLSVYNSMIRSQEVAKYFIHFNSLKSSLIIHGDRAAAAPATLRAVSLVTIKYN